jgi:hypothetical protein
MNITIHLEDEQVRKLTYIQQQTDLDLSVVVSRDISEVIETHYQQLQTKRESPLQIFEELGLVGCIDGDRNLSTNYKKAMVIDQPDGTTSWIR